MNERTNNAGHDAGDAALRLALRGLRQGRDPGRDLWAGIEARIHALPQPSSAAGTPRRWTWPVAMAASMLLSAGVAWQMRPAEAPAPTQATEARVAVATTLVQREASTLTVQYQAALRELEFQPTPATWQPGLDALDRSAAEIRSALQQNPDSRLLLERLRETYTRRLALSRRALYA
ncbi:MAG TPA: hypothetical protein VLC71_01590 [Thermomonas sp.]|nr:hypothetical protein [Thermomonas sp.]